MLTGTRFIVASLSCVGNMSCIAAYHKDLMGGEPTIVQVPPNVLPGYPRVVASYSHLTCLVRVRRQAK